MRALATCIVALGLAASPILARAARPGENDSRAAEAKNASTAASQPSNPSTAESKADPAAKAEPSSSELQNELQELRDILQSQTKQLQEQQQRMQMLEEQLKTATAAKENLTADPAENAAIGPVSGALAGGPDPAQGGKPEEPTALHYKGVTLTPGGFMAAETVWHQKALGADVNTPFNSVPFEGASQAHMSEFTASGRQSRISMLVEGKLENVKIGGYYEMDFLSAGTTSNPNQSNSYTMRQRQFWGQAAFDSGWTVTGGQMWSLLTETTKGMDNRTEALPQTIDAAYHIGFSWARQYGVRFTKNFDNKVWLGFSVEEPQATLTVHGNPTATCAPANPQVTGSVATCSASALNGTLVYVPTGTPAAPTVGTAAVNASSLNNFLLGAFGTSGGLLNPLANYQFNPAPDLIFKAVFEPGFGHYEIFGLVAQFRDRVFPCVTDAALAGCGGLATSGANAFNDSRTGGGGGANARWNLFNKKVDLGVHFLGGSGIGRYGSGGLSDATTRFVAEPTGTPASLQDGTLALIRNYQALGTLQFHPTPKLDINLNIGGEYNARTAYAKTVGAKPNEGYGGLGMNNYGCTTEILPFASTSSATNTVVPTGVAGANGFVPGQLQNCTGDTRNLIEGTIGFWYRFYKGPKGTVQYGMQYSNFVRNTWSGVPSATVNGITYTTNGTPHADENMFFTSFRYYLP